MRQGQAMYVKRLAGAGLLLLGSGAVLTFGGAEIPGLTGTEFHLTAKWGYISAADGLFLYTWGYSADMGMGDGMMGGLMQYPGPTLILEEDVPVTIHLMNEITWPTPVSVSIVFPGQTGVIAVGGDTGVLTQEAPPDGATMVMYSFTPTEPGTYIYHSGTDPALQTQMGLVGAIIVRPAGYTAAAPTAYGDTDTRYDHEYLFLLTEMDLALHQQVEFGHLAQVDPTTFYPVYWFINGRNAPDTMLMDMDGMPLPWLPHQPYNCMPRMHPGERMLLRIIGAGQDLHPFHTHGSHMTVIAQDGRPLDTGDFGAPSDYPDLAYRDFTVASVPGQTVDAIFEWTGAGLGWDIYGHSPADPLEPNEYAPDHGKPLPVVLPETQEITFGGHWSGSPFLGVWGDVPPGAGGGSMNAGFFYMWHSHSEKEMVNNDIFPGGMMTMLIIEAPDVPIP